MGQGPAAPVAVSVNHWAITGHGIPSQATWLPSEDDSLEKDSCELTAGEAPKAAMPVWTSGEGGLHLLAGMIFKTLNS